MVKRGTVGLALWGLLCLYVIAYFANLQVSSMPDCNWGDWSIFHSRHYRYAPRLSMTVFHPLAKVDALCRPGMWVQKHASVSDVQNTFDEW